MSEPDASRTPTAAEPPTHEELDRLWDDPPGLLGKLRAVQNDAVGVRLMLTGFFFLLLGGSVDSFVMRAQLALPDSELVGAQLYNELFTNHGSVTMFLVILPIFEGFAILLLPAMLGTREMPFPRLGAFAYWTFLMGGLLYYSSTLFQAVPDAGWFAYTPLSGPEFSPDLAIDFWVLGLGVAEVGAIAAAVEIIIGVLKMRAPGMSLSRIPLFAWAMLITSFMILFAFTPLIVGSLLLELERGFDMQFFDPALGGSSLLWQHLFWIFGHPEVYIQFLPATGIVSMIVPIAARKRFVGYPWMVAATVGIGFLSFGLWAHHMFVAGLPTIVLAFFGAASMVIAIPAGIQIFSWLATLWEGTIRWTTSFRFVVGFLVTFVLGGITGVMVASVPFDQQVHDTYFIVAHLHYVLIGGVAFPMFAGVYHWWPKFTGRMLSERLGRWNFWLLFIGVNVTFFPMHIAGLAGMPRRISTFPSDIGWDVPNLVSSAGLLLIIPGLAVFALNLVLSWRSGEPASADPWGGDSLEWSVPSPPDDHGWSVPPIVTSRHPLWDQEDLHAGEPETTKLVRALGEWPLRWRAAMVVGTADGRPEEVFRLATPSIWPLVSAIGLVGIFAAELTKVRLGAYVGAAVLIFGVVMWNRPDPPDMTREEEEAFEAEHGIPVRAGASLVMPRWGMGLAILFTSIAFGSFVLSYFYLRLENPVWPPAGVPLPSIQVALWSVVAVGAGVAAVLAGRRAIRLDDRPGLIRWLTVAALLAVIGAGIVVADLVEATFEAADHAYGSIVHTMTGFGVVVLGAAVIMVIATAVHAARGEYGEWRTSPVDNVVRFWIAAGVIWALGIGIVHVAPHLT